MSIDMASLEAIGVFASEDHPNRHSADTKDGFSLFRLLNRAHSFPGKRLLRSWCLRPLQDTARINERLDLVGALMRADLEPLASSLHRNLARVPNLKHVLLLLRKSPSAAGLQALLGFLRSLSSTIDTLQCMRLETGLLAHLAAADRGAVSALTRSIEQLVDFDESHVQNRVVILPRVDARLDDLRTVYAGLPDYLSVVARELSGRYAAFPLRSLSLVYFPQIGFLITVPAADGLADLGPELELQFATERFAYYKDERTREMDSSIGDLHTEIVDMEVEIVLGIQVQLAAVEAQLLAYADACAELDWYPPPPGGSAPDSQL